MERDLKANRRGQVLSLVFALMCDKQFTGFILIFANFMEIIWMEFKNQDQYFVAGGCAYFAETSKDYNAFETESEAWLPTTAPLATNLFEYLESRS